MHVELLAVPFDAYTAKLAAAVPHAHGPDLFVDAHERLGIYRQRGRRRRRWATRFPTRTSPPSTRRRVDAVTLDGAR